MKKLLAVALLVSISPGMLLKAEETAGRTKLRQRISEPVTQSAPQQPAAETPPGQTTPAAGPEQPAAAEPEPAVTAPEQAGASAAQASLWQNPADEYKAPSVETLAGFSIVPNNQWKTGQFVSYEDYLSVDFDATALTTYEGSIWHNKTGLKLGISADVENNVIGKLNRFMGFLGYKRFILRVQNGRLRGTAYWTGPAVAGQPGSTKFDNKYTNIDLLYWMKGGSNGMYWGLGYNEYALPVQVNAELYSASRGEIVYGNAVYQDNMEYKTYTAMFGFDTMTGAAMNSQRGW
ncbi:MAG: hypothetical protein PHW69_00400, partial [Elusimicrobiaceae bacterium]|nr:hypothetical protein [Elusimicrobiaceae bacterium]